jgi:hypothetical protein
MKPTFFVTGNVTGVGHVEDEIEAWDAVEAAGILRDRYAPGTFTLGQTVKL